MTAGSRDSRSQIEDVPYLLLLAAVRGIRSGRLAMHRTRRSRLGRGHNRFAGGLGAALGPQPLGLDGELPGRRLILQGPLFSAGHRGRLADHSGRVHGLDARPDVRRSEDLSGLLRGRRHLIPGLLLLRARDELVSRVGHVVGIVGVPGPLHVEPSSTHEGVHRRTLSLALPTPNVPRYHNATGSPASVASSHFRKSAPRKQVLRSPPPRQRARPHPLAAGALG